MLRSKWTSGRYSKLSILFHSLSSCVPPKCLPYSELFIRRQMNIFVALSSNKSWMTVREKTTFFFFALCGRLEYMTSEVHSNSNFSAMWPSTFWNANTRNPSHSRHLEPVSFACGSSDGQPHLSCSAGDKPQRALLSGPINVANRLQRMTGAQHSELTER